jgi:5,5'-dehydrodivanillate O-demethylase
MSEDFTLYRGASGTPHLLAFRCAHRGTQLSTGWVEGDDLRCFYHGWKYNGSGQCIEQPAEPEPFCQRIRIKGYPVQEYLGLIFAFLGEGEPPAMPRYPVLEQDGVVDNRIQTLACNYFNRLDNSMDPIHVAFVHYFRRVGSQFRSGRMPSLEAEETDWGFTTMTQWPEGLEGENPLHHYVMPNAFLIRIESNEDRGVREHCSWRVPVDDEHHLSVNASCLLISGEQAEAFRTHRQTQRSQGMDASRSDPAQKGEAVLAGEMALDDAENDWNLYDVQDYVAQVGQGRVVQQANDHLGYVDLGVSLLRKVWARELAKLSKNEPIKVWQPELIASTVVGGRATRKG